MPDFQDVEIGYVAPVTFLRERARKEQTLPISGSVRVQVPVATAADAPVVFRALHNANNPRVETVRLTRRMLDGRLYAPYRPAWANPGDMPRGMPVEQMVRVLSHPRDAMRPLFPGRVLPDGSGLHSPWSEDDTRKAVDLPTGIVRVSADARDEVERRVRAAADKLVFIDGIAWREQPVPRLSLLHHAESPELTQFVYTDETCYSWGYGFRVDRAGSFDALCRAHEDLGVTVNGAIDLEGEVMEPEALRFDEDRFNAAFALGHALATLGRSLILLPPEAVLALASAAAMRPTFAAGQGDASEADAALARLHDAIPATLPRLRATVALGRQAVALSLPSTNLSEDDAASFDGMRM